MSGANQESLRRVLIASANPLFARGLQKILVQHWQSQTVDIRFAGSMPETNAVLEAWQPDLVVLDYDDASPSGEPGLIRREVFLSRFIAGDRPMQVMLVSLRASGEVIVYDRRTLTPAQAEVWLDSPWAAPVDREQNQPERTHSEQEPHPLPAAAPASRPVTDNRSNLRSGGMKKHYIIAGVLALVLTLILGGILSSIGLMPVEASAQAVPIDQMINLQVWMIAFLFSLISVFIIYSTVVFRRRKSAARAGASIAAVSGSNALGAHIKGSNRLEVAWTIVPLITVIFLSFLGARDLGQIRKADSNALEVKVTAFQWGWSYQYTGSGVISNALVLPVNRQVHLLLTSRDVIHSFWVPEFRVKQDVLPGANLVKELRITPYRIGYYKVRCAEMCGLNHSGMEGLVMVTTQTGFDDWIGEMTKAANASSSPVERGQALAQNNGCTGCHTIDGSKLVGPTWKGLAGAQVTLADGTTVTADDAYLQTAIVDPNKQIHQGFATGIMPSNYKDKLSDQQIADIIAYIKTLK